MTLSHSRKRQKIEIRRYNIIKLVHRIHQRCSITSTITVSKKQGWEFAHRFFERRSFFVSERAKER